MFGKIKNKLRNVWKKNEDLIEESNDETILEDSSKSDEIISKIPENNDGENINKKNKLNKKNEVLSDEEDNIVNDSGEKSITKEETIIETEDKKIESEDEEKKEGFFSKTFKKLKSKNITEDDFDKIWIELEIFLLEINIAFEIVEKIEKTLKNELVGNSFNRFKLNEKIKEILSLEVKNVLSSREDDLLEKIKKIRETGEVVKIIILGVNGTGKTTTIAKFVNYLQSKNLSLVVAAADTFRAAAIEQLEEHSKKLNFKLIQHKGGSDPAAVSFDAIEHAKAKKLDVVLIDTAGRMPNNHNLMIELQKIKRVSNAQLTIFVGDSISGNDLIEQINLFDKGIKIDGIILTKVDTDDKPGSIVTTAYSIEKPIYFLGVGQNYEDLIKFNAGEISEKLFSIEDEE